ncbi:hypothetical protein FVE85_0356 [Porphyridium purpureum]|uniref:Uncharacterized protein n=1 Tax=Porphyridium purpureum TaxID=35688 RepID=A0A5J4Z1S1_PORPP|nr:hypothetical protein FVE85_0356 [Porphyridium purpureum]|eukprot:POR1319..scf208_2
MYSEETTGAMVVALQTALLALLFLATGYMMGVWYGPGTAPLGAGETDMRTALVSRAPAGSWGARESEKELVYNSPARQAFKGTSTQLPISWGVFHSMLICGPLPDVEQRDRCVDQYADISGAWTDTVTTFTNALCPDCDLPDFAKLLAMHEAEQNRSLFVFVVDGSSRPDVVQIFLDLGHHIWNCDHNETAGLGLSHERLEIVQPVNGICNADESMRHKVMDFLLFLNPKFTASSLFAAERHLSVAWFVLMDLETVALRMAKVKPQQILAMLERNEFGIAEVNRATLVTLNLRVTNTISHSTDQSYLRNPQSFRTYEYLLMDNRQDKLELGRLLVQNRRSTLFAFRFAEQISRL